MRAAPKRRACRRTAFADYAGRRAAHVVDRLRLREPLVQTGVVHGWFDEFNDYWTQCVGARPLTLIDFHQLRFLYRIRAQQTTKLSWHDAEEHVRNWQTPDNIAATFVLVYRSALSPIRPHVLGEVLHEGARVLEYGCSIAPAYRTWRRFFSHVDTRWVLADIAGFPFHYARHVYAHDLEADFVTIEDLSDPLGGVDGTFDAIVVQEVFEHLDHPCAVAEQLVRRLRPGGALIFDYIATEGLGHDTPGGCDERLETLDLLRHSLAFEDGALHVDDESLALTIGRG